MRQQARRVGRPAGPPSTVVWLPVAVAKMARVIAARGLRAGDINGLIDVQARRIDSRGRKWPQEFKRRIKTVPSKP